MSVVPKLRIPFQWGPGPAAVTCEQDSKEEISACVEAIVRTPMGSVEHAPAFGVADQTFSQSGALDGEVLRAISTYEPRASVEISENIDSLDDLIDQIDVSVGGGN